MLTTLTESDISLTAPAREKMGELIKQTEAGIEGVRVFAQPGGCSGMSYGMTFADAINPNDGVLDYGEVKIVIDYDSLEHLRGIEIDFVDGADGSASFVFNNLPAREGGGCGSCSSSGCS